MDRKRNTKRKTRHKSRKYKGKHKKQTPPPRAASTTPPGKGINDCTTTTPMGERPQGAGWELVLRDSKSQEDLFIRPNNNVPTPKQVAQAIQLEWKTFEPEDMVERFTANPIYAHEPHYLWEVLMYLMRFSMIDAIFVDKVEAAHPILRQLTWERNDVTMEHFLKINTPQGEILSKDDRIKLGSKFSKLTKTWSNRYYVMQGKIDDTIVNIEKAELLKHGEAPRYHMAVRGSTLTNETSPYLDQWLPKGAHQVDGPTQTRRRGILENRKSKVATTYIGKAPKFMRRDWHNPQKRKSHNADLSRRVSHEDKLLNELKEGGSLTLGGG